MTSIETSQLMHQCISCLHRPFRVQRPQVSWVAHGCRTAAATASEPPPAAASKDSSLPWPARGFRPPNTLLQSRLAVQFDGISVAQLLHCVCKVRRGGWLGRSAGRRSQRPLLRDLSSSGDHPCQEASGVHGRRCTLTAACWRRRPRAPHCSR